MPTSLQYHLDTMLLSQHMLEDWPFWFNFSDGDKDIFRFAFLALRKRWGVPGRYLGAGSLPGGQHSTCFLLLQALFTDARTMHQTMTLSADLVRKWSAALLSRSR